LGEGGYFDVENVRSYHRFVYVGVTGCSGSVGSGGGVNSCRIKQSGCFTCDCSPNLQRDKCRYRYFAWADVEASDFYPDCLAPLSYIPHEPSEGINFTNHDLPVSPGTIGAAMRNTEAGLAGVPKDNVIATYGKATYLLKYALSIILEYQDLMLQITAGAGKWTCGIADVFSVYWCC